jgi:hypothetical protein
MYADLRTGQNANIHSANICNVQKAINDPGNHHADGIHVSRYHYRSTPAIARASLESMQRANTADVCFINQSLPLLLNEPGYGSFVS